MASSKDYLQFVLEQLSELQEIITDFSANLTTGGKVGYTRLKQSFQIYSSSIPIFVISDLR